MAYTYNVKRKNPNHQRAGCGNRYIRPEFQKFIGIVIRDKEK
jgi:hypothetical protein